MSKTITKTFTLIAVLGLIFINLEQSCRASVECRAIGTNPSSRDQGCYMNEDDNEQECKKKLLEDLKQGGIVEISMCNSDVSYEQCWEFVKNNQPCPGPTSGN